MTAPARIAGNSSPVSIVAYHEAGHAVVAWLAFRALNQSPPSLPVTEVWIDVGDTLQGDGRRLGQCHPSPDRTAGEMLKWSLVVDFAGGLAEAIYRGESNRRSALMFAMASCGMAGGDLAAIERTITVLRILTNNYDRSRDEVYRHFAGRAWDLLKKNWPAVESIANALIERRRLSGSEVEALIKRSVD